MTERAEDSCEVVSDRENKPEVLSFETVLDFLQDRIWLYVLNQVNLPDAEDIYQNIAIDCYRGFDGLKDPHRFAGWTYRIAQHRITDFLRSKYRAPESLPLVELEVTGDWSSQLSFSDDALLKRQLHQCIQKLREPVRQAAQLHFQFGFTIQEAAEALDKNEQTVRSWIHRCKSLIARCVRGGP